MKIKDIRSSIEELNVMLEDMQKAPPLFQATQFWANSLKEIIDDLENQGFENFKSHKSALKLYVQRYAQDPYLYQKELCKQICDTVAPLQYHLDTAFTEYMNGKNQSDADYRVFIAADKKDQRPHLQHIGEDLFGNPADDYSAAGRYYSVSLLSYLRQLAF